MTDDKIILTLVGQSSSGKGTICQYINEKYDGGSCRYSTIFRDIADRLYLPQSRENLQIISILLRQQLGDDLLARIIAKDAEKINKKIITVDGARRISDLIELKKLPGFYLIYVDADERVRYERIVSRRENTDDQTKTFQDFQKDAMAETELRIADMKKEADFVINNDGTLEELQKHIDELIKKIQA